MTIMVSLGPSSDVLEKLAMASKTHSPTPSIPHVGRSLIEMTAP